MGLVALMAASIASAQTDAVPVPPAEMPTTPPSARPANLPIPPVPPPPGADGKVKPGYDLKTMKKRMEAFQQNRQQVKEDRKDMKEDRAEFRATVQTGKKEIREEGKAMREDMRNKIQGAVTPEARKALGDEMKDKREAMQDKRKEFRGKVKEERKEFVQKHLTIAGQRFGGVINQFDTILTKLNEYVTKRKSEGATTTDAEAAIAAAKTATDSAKTAIAKVTEISGTIGTGDADKDAIKAAVQAANDAIKAAHAALKTAGEKVRALKPADTKPATQ